MKEKGEGMRKMGEKEVTLTEHNNVLLTPVLSAVQQLSPCEPSPPLGSCVETAPDKTGAGQLERGETLCLQAEGAEDVIKEECRKSGLYQMDERKKEDEIIVVQVLPLLSAAVTVSFLSLHLFVAQN